MDAAGVAALTMGKQTVPCLQEGTFHVIDILRLAFRHPTITVIGRQQQFADLSCQGSVEIRMIQRVVIKVDDTRHTIEFRTIHHHDIQDSIHTFRILSCTRVSNHLNTFDH